jgi:hypothetical protein
VGGGEIRQVRKLNPTVVQRLVEMYRLGATLADACRYAGIARQTLYDWIEEGRAHLDYIANAPDGDYDLSEQATLVLLLDRASAEFAKRQLEKINVAAGREWTAAAWLLERRLPDEWAKRERVDHTHTIISEVERLAQERGLDAEATARLRDFAAERARRRAG